MDVDCRNYCSFIFMTFRVHRTATLHGVANNNNNKKVKKKNKTNKCLAYIVCLEFVRDFHMISCI